MKKKVIISIIAFSLIIGGTVLTNAKPKSNLARIMKRKNQRKITNTEYHYMEKYQKKQKKLMI